MDKTLMFLFAVFSLIKGNYAISCYSCEISIDGGSTSCKTVDSNTPRADVFIGSSRTCEYCQTEIVSEPNYFSVKRSCQLDCMEGQLTSQGYSSTVTCCNSHLCNNQQFQEQNNFLELTCYACGYAVNNGAVVEDSDQGCNAPSLTSGAPTKSVVWDTNSKCQYCKVEIAVKTPATSPSGVVLRSCEKVCQPGASDHGGLPSTIKCCQEDRCNDDPAFTESTNTASLRMTGCFTGSLAAAISFMIFYLL